MYEPASLDIGDSISYKIPPKYDKLASMLNLPNFSDIQVEEFYLKGTLDLGSLAAMMATDKRFKTTIRAGMGEPVSQYESLQERLKAMSASNLPHKFSLKVSDVGLHSSIPEGAAGSIKRSILSEGGVLQIYYVKVLEKGDTYEVCVSWDIVMRELLFIFIYFLPLYFLSTLTFNCFRSLSVAYLRSKR